MAKVYGMTPVKMNVGNVEPWDTILCSDGKWRTVCKNNIKTNGVMGTRVHGERGELLVLRPSKK